MTEIVFWQSMISPHQAGLVRALAAKPGIDVHYVAAQTIEPHRAAMGWAQPDLGQARLHLAETKEKIAALAGRFSQDALHLCQGFRGNGMIAHALPALAGRGAHIGVVMEAVDPRGGTAWLKMLLYRHQIRRYRGAVAFCLAIGQKTKHFLEQCGFPSSQIYPFSYFLTPPPPSSPIDGHERRLVYVGKLVQLKRVDLLIEAFGALSPPRTRLSLIGSGPLERELRALAATQPNAEAIEWLGTLPHAEAQALIAASDGLILPSEYDGWGAVVSEALLAGAPAICSSACGAAEAVRASNMGGVFASGEKLSLMQNLLALLAADRWSHAQRAALRTWARTSLSDEAGAAHLEVILAAHQLGSPAPEAPWLCPQVAEKPQEIKTFVTG
ncbi:MAG: glycosyltransferase [Pseudomonadota bacterium]